MVRACVKIHIDIRRSDRPVAVIAETHLLHFLADNPAVEIYPPVGDKSSMKILSVFYAYFVPAVVADIIFGDVPCNSLERFSPAASAEGIVDNSCRI